ncbi:MAG: hypothetical protein Q9166_007503 [cf. Caloplaca sp. 2 TL-2023]
MDAIESFNAAVDRTPTHTGSCSICCDTLGTSEDNSSSGLTILTLEHCNHHFHEYCLMKWLGPIFLPPATKLLDPVVRVLEKRSDILETLGQLPLTSASRETLVEMVDTDLAGYDVDATVEAALEESYGADDELGEGEIRAVPQADAGALDRVPTFIGVNNIPDFQDLPPANPFTDLRFTREVRMSDLPGWIPSHSCPYCRQPVTINDISCHTDTLQMIRVRLRLTNLAYQCFGIKRTDRETTEHKSIQAFLARHYADDQLLNATTPIMLYYRRIVKQARLTLRQEVFRYMKHHRLTSAESLRVMQLAMFFENFKLNEERELYFFSPNPHLDFDWAFAPSVEEFRFLHSSPATFCRNLKIVPNRARKLNTSSVVLRDPRKEDLGSNDASEEESEEASDDDSEDNTDNDAGERSIPEDPENLDMMDTNSGEEFQSIE